MKLIVKFVGAGIVLGGLIAASVGPLVAQQAGQGCFPGLGAVIEQFRCKKNDIIKGFPQGSGNGGQTGGGGAPTQNPIPSTIPPGAAPSQQGFGGQPQLSQRRFSTYRGYDLYGGDYARTKKNQYFTQARCVEVCRQESTCVAFTYNTRHGVCFLKDELPRYLKPYRSAVSGVLSHMRQPPKRDSIGQGGQGGQEPGLAGPDVAGPSTPQPPYQPPTQQPPYQQPPVQQVGACGNGYTTYDRTDFRGNDIAGHKVSFRSCRSKCTRSSGCAGFAWIKTKARKRCWLKYDTSTAQRKRNVLSCVKLAGGANGDDD